MSPPNITYQIRVGAREITCTPSNGNGRFHQKAVLQWDTNQNCTLQFFTYDSNKSTGAWPFVKPAPNPRYPYEAPVTPKIPFQGTLKPVADGEQAPSYAYSIEATGVETLDPIIIVDK